ncbi:hypothetical protein ACRTC3_07655 [Photobacterium damselae]|uniref:hypothetical protein n=1 Tax=Photobacterium damselae TaxID=38293 RepID=UPI003D7CCB72
MNEYGCYSSSYIEPRHQDSDDDYLRCDAFYSNSASDYEDYQAQLRHADPNYHRQHWTALAGWARR